MNATLSLSAPWFRLVRLPAVLTALSNVIAAWLIVAWPGGSAFQLLMLMAATACLYSGGMALNDCFDLDEDRRDRPGRPLPSGAVGVREGWLGGFLLLAVGTVLAAFAAPASGAVAIVLVAAILAYNGWLKSTPAASLAMAACRFLNWLMALAVVGLTWTTCLLALPAFLYVAALTEISREETRAADRRVLLRAGGGLVLATLVVCALAWIDGGLALLAIPGALAGLWIVGVRLRRAWGEFNAGALQALVGFMIFGIVPLDALVVLAAGPAWAAPLLLLLMLPGRWLARRMYVT